MVSVEELRDYYENAPVRSVNWEIKYETDVDLSDSLGEFAKGFGTYKEIKITQFTQKLILDGELEIPTRELIDKGYEIWDRNKVISVTSSKLSSSTRSHKNYIDFVEFLESVLSKFGESIYSKHALRISRIGLRYVNFCKYPPYGKTLDYYFSIPLITTRNRIEEVHLSFLEVAELEEEEPYRLVTQFHSVEENAQPYMVIDLDCFRMEKIEFSHLVDYTSEFHKVIKERFADSIMDNFHQEVMK